MTLEEALGAEGLHDSQGKAVVTVDYLAFLCRWLAGRLREDDASMLALAHGVKIETGKK